MLTSDLCLFMNDKNVMGVSRPTMKFYKFLIGSKTIFASITRYVTKKIHARYTSTNQDTQGYFTPGYTRVNNEGCQRYISQN